MNETLKPKQISEEDNLQVEWMKRAKGMTLAELPEFLQELSAGYKHDYGTICHAIAAAAVAAAWAVEKSPQGGISGFQAGAVGWEFLRGWGSPGLGKIGTRIQRMDDLLFPQYVDDFTSITSDVWEALQAKAAENIAEKSKHVHPRVLSHWEAIAAGHLPTGIRVKPA